MLILLASAVLDLIGFGIILPLLPFYAQTYGASPFVVTLLSVTFSVAQTLAAPLLGRLSDHYGRKPVFLSCLVVTIVGYLWLGYADTLIELFLARSLAGASAGKIAVTQSIMTDITSSEDRARGMGLLGAGFGFGMIIGPSIGGLLVGDPANPNYHAPAFAAAAGSAVALIFALFMLPESLKRSAAPSKPTAEATVIERLALLRGHRQFAALIALTFLVQFVFSQIETLFPLWTAQVLGWGPLQVGVAFTFIGVSVVAVQGGAIGPTTRRWGEFRVLGCGMLAMAIGALATPAVQGTASLYLNVAITSIGLGFTSPVLTTLASRLADPARLGAMLGLATAAGSLGRVLGPGFGGFLFELLGPTAPYVIGGVMLVAALGLLWPRLRAPAQA